jgi:hypothetical protein
MLVSPVVRFTRFIPFWTFLFSSFFFFQKTGKYDKTHVEKVNPTNCWVDPGSQLQRSTFQLLRRPKKRDNNRKRMFEIFIFLKKISHTSFWVLPYFSKYHISHVLRVLSMRNIPSWPSGRALFSRKFWMTPLVKCLSYIENKNVREKKIKKITHTKKNFFSFSYCSCLRSTDLKISARSDGFYFQLFFSFE